MDFESSILLLAVSLDSQSMGRLQQDVLKFIQVFPVDIVIFP